MKAPKMWLGAVGIVLAGCAPHVPITPWTSPEVEEARRICLDAEGLWMETQTMYTCRMSVSGPRT